MKRISALVVLGLLMALLCNIAYAASSSDKVLREVEKTNSEIDAMIEQTRQQCEEYLLQCSPEEADELIDDAIDNLVDTTNDMAEKTMEWAADQGYTVECQLVEVEICGRFIWIDPLRVVGW